MLRICCLIGCRDFIMNAFDLTEDQAITAITVAMDFGIDQVRCPLFLLKCKMRPWELFLNLVLGGTLLKMTRIAAPQKMLICVRGYC